MHDSLSTVVATLGIGHLPQEEQEEIAAAFGETALRAATAAVMEKMPETAKEAFATLLEQGDAAGAAALLEREVPNHKEVAAAAVQGEAASFKEAMAS